MSVGELLREVGPVCVLCGSDRYAVDARVAELRSVFQAGLFPEMNIELFYGDEQGAQAIQDACNSMPAFAEGRLVIWRGHSKAQGSKMLSQLAEYCAKPNPSTMLVLILPTEPDGRLKAVKAVKKAGYLIQFQMPAEPKVIAWATEQAKTRGLALDQDGVRRLVAALGCDRHALMDALEKLDLYAQGAVVDAAMMDAVVQPVLDEDVWALADLLASGRLADALILMQRLLDEQRSGHELVPGLAYRFRSLARMVGARAAKVPNNQMAKAAGVAPWELRRSGSLVGRWTPERITLALAALGRADDRLKGGWGASERVTLEALCLEVCSA